MAGSIAAGARAPDFRLPTTDGERSLGDLLADGQRLVLAFYAEDGTPACETELTMLRDASAMLAEFRARVLALSADTLDAHAAFAGRLGGLPFPLASDTALTAARAYGVIDDGDPRRSRRAVFVIDSDGVVLLALPHFQPHNLAQVEAIFAALGAEA
ncbi:MAG: redoxin domain-containing protein [Dehalococcoidia bacterium]